MFGVPFGVRSHATVFVQRDNGNAERSFSDVRTKQTRSQLWVIYFIVYRSECRCVSNKIYGWWPYRSSSTYRRLADLTFLANAMSVSFRNFTILNTDNIIFMSSCRFTSTVYCCNIACRTTDNVNKKKRATPTSLVSRAYVMQCIHTTHRHLHSHSQLTRMHLCTNILLRCALRQGIQRAVRLTVSTSKCVTLRILFGTRQLSSSLPFITCCAVCSLQCAFYCEIASCAVFVHT